LLAPSVVWHGAAMPARRVRTLARALGVERPARAARRRLLPAHVRRDIRDHELLVALLERELREDADCLDVGAHAGSVLRELVRLAPRGRHVAWEPLPAFAASLRSRFPGVEVREAALADEAGEQELTHVIERPGWSSLAPRPTPGGGPTETIAVSCERLDDVLEDRVRPRFMKIDVEGAEARVLRGARRTLLEHRPLIVFEHGAGSAEYHGTGPADIHGLLNELGYAIFGLDGDGAYDAARFTAIVAAGERVNFVARAATAR
jgi:FkbM family methyltransferase